MLPSVCGENLNYDDKKDHYVRYPFAYMKKRPVFTRGPENSKKIDTLSPNLQAEDVMIRVGVFAGFG